MDNLQAPTLGSLIYFMMAPTLCYQPSYPRTENVRKGWLIRQIILYLIFTGIQGFIIEQYINPIVVNSQHPLKGGLLNAVETVLRLSLPNVYLWLCMFYCFFHLWLNILAEILRFGDREFYKDWWNAKTIDEYWRKWNMPVHKWIVRHIYFPCMRSGISKEVAVFVSFFVSAVLHEACCCCPLPNSEVLGIPRDHAADPPYHIDIMPQKQIQGYNGRQHDILVLFLHLRPAYVRSPVLP
uniref:Diacylglycerol O-acyltransferase n=1 Tax=Aegilops tauschii subsp. strangulata TaxID=200361 RepID=A0A452Y6J9_AEGTS